MPTVYSAVSLLMSWWSDEKGGGGGRERPDIAKRSFL